jgi:hypothetical protein
MFSRCKRFLVAALVAAAVLVPAAVAFAPAASATQHCITWTYSGDQFQGCASYGNGYLYNMSVQVWNYQSTDAWTEYINSSLWDGAWGPIELTPGGSWFEQPVLNEPWGIPGYFITFEACRYAAFCTARTVEIGKGF